MKFLKFKRRNLFENYINHYINAFHTRVIINNYNDSSIYLLWYYCEFNWNYALCDFLISFVVVLIIIWMLYSWNEIMTKVKWYYVSVSIPFNDFIFFIKENCRLNINFSIQSLKMLNLSSMITFFSNL